MEIKWLRFVLRRRVFIIGLIIIQLAFILFLIAGTNRNFHYVDYVLQGFSVVVCIYILNKKEKSAYKLTWIFLILLFPLFGGAVYVFFHTQSSPRKLKKQMTEANLRFRPFFNPADDVLPELAEEHREYLPQAHYLQKYAGFPVYKHTQTHYLNSGESFFAQVLEELKEAKKYIFLEFFILNHGKMLDPIIELLS